MHVLSPSPQLDRTRLLRDAQRAQLRGRYRRAVALYECALARGTDDIEVSARLAPLLAMTGRRFEAWQQFRKVGRELVAQRRHEWALSIFREAARCLPHEFEAWRIVAELEYKLGRPEAALETLLEGRSQFTTPVHRDQAIRLLQLARKLESWDTDVVLDLAQLLASGERSANALEILERQACRCSPRDLRRVRAAQFRITWAPQDLWIWLCTLLPSKAASREVSIAAAAKSLLPN